MKVGLARLKSKRSRRRSQQAAATMELALMLPLLLSVAFICVDYGRFVHSYIAITNATRAGAAYASMHPVVPATQAAWEAAIRQKIIDELTGNAWFSSASLITNSPAPVMISEGAGYRRVKVEVTYPFSTIISWPLFGSGTRNMHRTVVMRQIR